MFTPHTGADKSTIRYIINGEECSWRKDDEGVHGNEITKAGAKLLGGKVSIEMSEMITGHTTPSY